MDEPLDCLTVCLVLLTLAVAAVVGVCWRLWEWARGKGKR